MTGSALVTGQYDFKNALYTAALDTVFDPAQVLVTFGHPGEERLDDIVFFGATRSTQDPATQSSNRRAREETLEVDVHFSSYRGGGWQAELEASQAAVAMLQNLEYYVRQTDTYLGGVMRECFFLRSQSDGWTVVDDIRPVGRNITIDATFGGHIRIEGQRL